MYSLFFVLHNVMSSYILVHNVTEFINEMLSKSVYLMLIKKQKTKQMHNPFYYDPILIFYCLAVVLFYVH